MSAPLRLHQIALACLLAASLPSVKAAPLALSSAPPNASSTEPAPNVVLSIDDSDSMAWPLIPGNDSSGKKYELLKQSLIATFGDGSANSGIIPDGRIRLAWHAMHNGGNSTGAKSLTPGAENTIRPFSGPHRENFWKFVQSIATGSGTPALEMMQRVADYARTPQGLNSPWADVPGVAQNPSDKPYLTCRRMYNILLTDGAWNAHNHLQRVSSGDSTTQTLPNGQSYNVTADQTRVYRDSYGDTTPTQASTLSDFAFQAWATDAQDGTGSTAAMANGLRPLINKRGPETFATPTCTSNGNCIQTQEFWNPRNNPATWQHVSLYTIGFGLGTVNWTFRRSPVATSKIYYTNQTMYDANPNATNKEKATNVDISERATPVDWSTNNTSKDTFGGDLPRLIQGELQWPNPKTEVGWNFEVDHTRPIELWHAAINGRGRFFPVTTASGLTAAFTEILNQVIKDTSVPLVSIATNSSSLRRGMMAYVAGYSAAEGTGTLAAREIDPSTGNIRSAESWNAAALLDALTSAQIINRVVLTSNGSSGIAFKTLGNLSTNTQGKLNSNAAGGNDKRGQARLNFIRGDQSNTVDSGGTFRSRTSRMGAIVNSKVLYVGAPAAAQGLSDNFATFANEQRSRTPMLYVGASDGMLHGFQASNGAERLAYVPLGLAEGRLRQLTDTAHEMQYFVDGSPFYGDVSSNGWRTLLVGTGGNGVKGWFVLDITDPANFTDAKADSVVRTDTTASGDADIGHIVSEPSVDDVTGKSRQIVKLNNGRWAAVMGNGVNSTNEAPVLMIQYLDSSPSILKLSPCGSPIEITACTFKGNNGLATPALVDINGDGVVDIAYAGDLRGHVWKFDLRSSDP
ncbi:MAG: pilus assembly protein, partial [Rubrivivax sp.]